MSRAKNNLNRDLMSSGVMNSKEEAQSKLLAVEVTSELPIEKESERNPIASLESVPDIA